MTLTPNTVASTFSQASNAASVMGHNERAVRLGLLANDARKGLERVSGGEAEAVEGWLAYGTALNEGRALFPSDEQFGQWVAETVNTNLVNTPRPEERLAAMWAAANPAQFAEARLAGNARTVRGMHTKWKEIEAAREAEAEREKAIAARLHAEAKAGAEAEARQAAKDAQNETERVAALERAQQEAEARKIAEDEAWEADKRARIAEKKATAKIKPDSDQHYRAINTGENEWYTPSEFVEMARKVMGAIDLDPASCPEANEIVNAAQIYTERDSGLDKEWSGRVWLNPPYSRDLMPKFCDKLASHVDAGDISAAILVAHNNTDTGWFHRLTKSCSAVCFPSKRIRFYRGDDVAAPTNGQVFVYFGNDVAAFKAEFSSIGWVAMAA